MDDAHDAEPEHSPYVRLPWPLVAAGLVGVLLVALGAGLLANRYVRPQVSVQPTPVSPAAAAPAPTSAPLPTVAPTPAPTPAPMAAPPVVATEPRPSATTPPANVVPTSTLASTPTSASIATLTASTLPTVDPLLAHEVGRGYETFWRVRSQALLELDTTHLAEVMDGDYLANIAQDIDSLRAEGRAIKTQVILNYSVVSATRESANVVDFVEDNSIYVNIGTEDPQTSPTADQLRVLYRLQNFSGTWKVVDSVRSE